MDQPTDRIRLSLFLSQISRMDRLGACEWAYQARLTTIIDLEPVAYVLLKREKSNTSCACIRGDEKGQKTRRTPTRERNHWRSVAYSRGRYTSSRTVQAKLFLFARASSWYLKTSIFDPFYLRFSGQIDLYLLFLLPAESGQLEYPYSLKLKPLQKASFISFRSETFTRIQV